MLCGCGCGQELPAPSYKGRPRKFIHGHNTRGTRRVAAPVSEDRGYVTPCLIYQGYVMANGYGNSGGKLAHVLAWKAANGPVPSGKELDHLCRVRRCVRIDHLEPVTRAVNARRGRAAKLTEAEVREIRVRYVSGADRRLLASEFGIAACSVSNIAARRTWAEVA